MITIVSMLIANKNRPARSTSPILLSTDYIRLLVCRRGNDCIAAKLWVMAINAGGKA